MHNTLSEMRSGNKLHQNEVGKTLIEIYVRLTSYFAVLLEIIHTNLMNYKASSEELNLNQTQPNNTQKVKLFFTHYSVMLQIGHNGILVPVRTSFGLHWRGGKTYNVSM